LLTDIHHVLYICPRYGTSRAKGHLRESGSGIMDSGYMLPEQNKINNNKDKKIIKNK
jgi:hypothetical protein